MHEWQVENDFEEASKAAAEFLRQQIDTAIKSRGVCHIVLPGGNTPALSLSLLARMDLPWHKVHWYLGDERCYPVDHPERNDVMLEKNLWSLIKDPLVHQIPAELGAEQGAEAYREIISAIDTFDVVFLGMGEDGHTASLFPGNPALQDSQSVVAVYDSPKPPPERISLGIETLRKARFRMVLAAGESKQEMIRRIKNDEPLPVNSIGDIHWFVDRSAFS